MLLATSTFLALVFLVYCNGRAACIGLAVASFYILYGHLKQAKYFNTFKWLSVGFIVFFTLCMIWYKADSSSGRLLIFKVSFKIFTDNIWFGNGPFEANYNNYQSAYFNTHNINSKEALLADNTFYAFNDYYQFLIENGIVGFTILILLAFLFYKKIWKVKIKETQVPLSTAAKASIICILVAALFSYPLQIFPIICQFVFCLSILIFLAINNSITISRSTRVFYNASATLLMLLFIFYALFQINYKIKSAEALELSRAGFKTKAVKQYEILSTSYFNDGNDIFLYAKELYNVGQVAKAKEVLNIAKTKIAFNEVYKFSASIEMEMKNYKNAEQDLLKVIYMIPNRMQPRINMMEFYLQQKDTVQATFWANSVVNMPVKIVSETTIALQNKAKAFLAK